MLLTHGPVLCLGFLMDHSSSLGRRGAMGYPKRDQTQAPSLTPLPAMPSPHVSALRLPMAPSPDGTS